MNTDGASISRFVLLLLVSLLLHAGVIISVTDSGRKEARHRHISQISQNMVVEYPDELSSRSQHSDPVIQRTVTQPQPDQKVKNSIAPDHGHGLTPTAGNVMQNNAPVPDAPPSNPSTPAGSSELAIGAKVEAPTTFNPDAGAGGQKAEGSNASLQRSSTDSAAPTVALQRRDTYQTLLKQLIEAHKHYPPAARRLGREGSCRRRFVISRDGSLKQVEALSSCGHAFLDEAATQAIAAVGTFPPLTDDFKGADETFTIIMTFTLAR
ncbi:MAG: energy transducer TonB [Desulfuromonadales bacterium]